MTVTAEQSFLERIDRINELGARSGFTLSTIKRSFGRVGLHYTTLSRCAVRYVQLTGCAQREAVKIFGITDGTVSTALAKERRRA